GAKEGLGVLDVTQVIQTFGHARLKSLVPKRYSKPYKGPKNVKYDKYKVYTPETFTAIRQLVLQDPQDANLNAWLFKVTDDCNAGVEQPVDPWCFCTYEPQWTAAIFA
ncbi:UNVERIFIED_CONTAM: hypothetical protein HDU68_002380, partial [Siphonaria sp. JEL0065]